MIQLLRRPGKRLDHFADILPDGSAILRNQPRLQLRRQIGQKAHGERRQQIANDFIG